MHFFVVHHIIETRIGITAALYHAVSARVLEKSANAAVPVVDKQHLCRIWKNLDNFSDDALGSDHCHVGAHVGRAALG